MPSDNSLVPHLERALDVAGEKEYRRLLRALRMARGSFFLFPIESDFPNGLRDMLLERLRADLVVQSVCLRAAALNRQRWDVLALPEMETPISEADVVVLLGLEETPGIVPEIGAAPVRPPALALLNQQREALHRRVPAPFLVWCPPYVFTTLMEQAPDFFDHFTSLFRFHNAAAQPISVGSISWRFNVNEPKQSTVLSSATARMVATFYEEQIAQHPNPTLERAHTLLGLADALLALHGPDYSQHVRRTLHLVEEALALLSSERDACEWARGQIIKGMAYLVLSSGDKTQNLQQAIACFEAALHIATETTLPREWAKAQNNLGNAYYSLPTGDRTQNIQQAIACYQATLLVYTETDFPYEWATSQSNLGNAYHDLLIGNRTQNLLCAIKYCEAALRVRTEVESPYNWAMTQNNLGNAYAELLSGDRTQNLQQAIVCYEAALRVCTEVEFPYEWAKLQYNMGIVYRNLLTGDRAQNLFRTVECNEAALRVYSEAEIPYEWALTQFNLALAQGELGNRIAARLALHRAAAGFLEAGVETEAKQAEVLLLHI